MNTLFQTLHNRPTILIVAVVALERNTASPKRMLLLLLVSGLPVCLVAEDHFPTPAPVHVLMRDGKGLAADVFLPSPKGRWPTILIFTPYNKKVLGSALPGAARVSDLFGRGDYAFVIADWRGFYGSKGAAVRNGKPALRQVGKDGHDIVEWIAAQSWSDGKVGMWGPSALGMAQYQTAAEKPPHLSCIVPVVARFGTAYEDYFHGGVFKRAHALVRENVGFKGSMKIITDHPVRDRFWNFVELTTRLSFAKLDLPILVIGGWFDTETDALIDTFKRIRSSAGPIAREQSRLLVGPWDHMGAGAGKRKVGELAFKEAERVSEREAHRFFDYWLRGKKDNGWKDFPDVRYFQMGSRKWEAAETWPPPGNKAKTFYLQAGGQLARQPGQGDKPADTFRYDPNDPSPTIGGMVIHASWVASTRATPAGPVDQREKVERRNDHVSYTTKALDSDLAVKGIARARLFVSSDQVDTDFVVRLCDVHPDGRSMLVTDGAHRMRFRSSLQEPQLMEPGQVYEVTVSCQGTAHTFLKGHRIRILVSSSNFPRFDANPNNGEHFTGGAKKALVATNSVYFDAAHPSALVLPVGADSPDRPRAGEAGPFRLETIEFPDLRDVQRGRRRVPMKVHFPREAGRYPLAIFSHGGAGNWDAHLYQARHLASHGYVSLCLEHVYSNNVRVKMLAFGAKGTLKERFNEALLGITKDPKAVLERPKDASFAIDKAIEWDRMHPELRGKIDTKKIAVIGHSYGAHTVLAVCGARPILKYLEPAVGPGKGLAGNLSDPRVTIGIAMSPQGPGTSRFGRESYKTINRPLLCFSGSKDLQFGHDGRQQPAEKRLEGFRLFPAGEKYMLWLEKADHFAFADNPKAHLFPSSARRDAQRICKVMALAFCDAYLKGSDKARKQLTEAHADALCGEVVDDVKWYEK